MARASHDPKLTMLGEVPILAGLNRRHLERVGQLCTRLDVDAGTVLCREGRSGHEFFIVIEGEASVSAEGAEVATVGPGGFFGELALLGGGPRTATVTATTPMSVFVLSGSEFALLLKDEPTVAVAMLPSIGARIRAATTAPQTRPLGS